MVSWRFTGAPQPKLELQIQHFDQPAFLFLGILHNTNQDVRTDSSLDVIRVRRRKSAAEFDQLRSSVAQFNRHLTGLDNG